MCFKQKIGRAAIWDESTTSPSGQKKKKVVKGEGRRVGLDIPISLPPPKYVINVTTYTQLRNNMTMLFSPKVAVVTMSRLIVENLLRNRMTWKPRCRVPSSGYFMRNIRALSC